MSPQGSYVKLMFDIWFPSCKVMAEESFPFHITSERTKRVLSVTYYFLSAYSSILYCKLLQGVLQTQTHIRTQIFKYSLQRQDFSSKFLWCFDSTLHFSVTKSFFFMERKALVKYVLSPFMSVVSRQVVENCSLILSIKFSPQIKGKSYFLQVSKIHR